MGARGRAAGSCSRMASHSGVRIDEDILEGIMEDSGCKDYYDVLEECLADNQRDWTKCQKQLKAWRGCFNRSDKSVAAAGAAGAALVKPCAK